MRNVDPFETDARALRVAVELPETFRPNTDMIAMTGTVQFAGSAPQAQRFALVPATAGPLESALQSDVPNGSAILFYRLDDTSIPAFETFRKTAQAVDRGAAEASGSLGVDTPVCRLTETVPPQVPVTVYLKAAEVARYVTLVRSADILEDTSAQTRAIAVPPCDSG